MRGGGGGLIADSALRKNCKVFDLLVPGLLEVLAVSEPNDVSLAASLVLRLLHCVEGLGKGVMYCEPSGGHSLLSLPGLKRCEADGKRESSL
jgi:hypothetical protein